MQTDIDFMKIALEEAREAYRCGEVPVGAVLVLEGNVLTQAYNSPIMRNDPSAHAEMLVLRQAGEAIVITGLPEPIFTLHWNPV